MEKRADPFIEPEVVVIARWKEQISDCSPSHMQKK